MMTSVPRARLLAGAAILLIAVGAAADEAAVAEFVRLGGDTTVSRSDREAFSAPAANLAPDNMPAFLRGRALFRRDWTIAPGRDPERDGLGPLFNRTSCAGCHVKDGRGQPPVSPDEPMRSMVVRLSVPGAGPHGGPRPHPVYGDQLADRGILGVPREGRAIITYEELPGRYGDGTPYSLRKPVVSLIEPGHGPFGDEILLSARVAPAVIGLGLLEAVGEDTILALADPDDAAGDGISGRANLVWDAVDQRSVLGRFGWKAGQPSLRQHIARAALADIGLTTSLFPAENCTPAQAACLAAPSGGAPELADHDLDALVLYIRTLAVPARRNADDPVVGRGEALFAAIGCASCHVPELVTGDHRLPELANQVIRPYTDLLLHDMGDGLADCRPEFAAGGREWRTAPLWGIGLVETVNRHTNFLHDGRARNLAEAILWHGGEAEAAREAFRTLPAVERAALLRFLESL